MDLEIYNTLVVINLSKLYIFFRFQGIKTSITIVRPK